MSNEHVHYEIEIHDGKHGWRASTPKHDSLTRAADVARDLARSPFTSSDTGIRIIEVKTTRIVSHIIRERSNESVDLLAIKVREYYTLDEIEALRDRVYTLLKASNQGVKVLLRVRLAPVYDVLDNLTACLEKNSQCGLPERTEETLVDLGLLVNGEG